MSLCLDFYVIAYTAGLDASHATVAQRLLAQQRRDRHPHRRRPVGRLGVGRVQNTDGPLVRCVYCIPSYQLYRSTFMRSMRYEMVCSMYFVYTYCTCEIMCACATTARATYSRSTRRRSCSRYRCVCTFYQAGKALLSRWLLLLTCDLMVWLFSQLHLPSVHVQSCSVLRVHYPDLMLWQPLLSLCLLLLCRRSQPVRPRPSSPIHYDWHVDGDGVVRRHGHPRGTLCCAARSGIHCGGTVS